MKTKGRKENNMRIVLFQGAFDILNAGHVKALKRAKKLGDKLIVALNTDALYKEYKNERGSIIPYAQRKTILEGLACVDLVVPISTFSPLRLLKKYNADVYVLTREWESSKAEEIAYMKAKGGQVSFSPRYKIMCSSDIRARIIERHLAK